VFGVTDYFGSKFGSSGSGLGGAGAEGWNSSSHHWRGGGDSRASRLGGSRFGSGMRRVEEEEEEAMLGDDEEDGEGDVGMLGGRGDLGHEGANPWGREQERGMGGDSAGVIRL